MTRCGPESDEQGGSLMTRHDFLCARIASLYLKMDLNEAKIEALRIGIEILKSELRRWQIYVAVLEKIYPFVCRICEARIAQKVVEPCGDMFCDTCVPETNGSHCRKCQAPVTLTTMLDLPPFDLDNFDLFWKQLKNQRKYIQLSIQTKHEPFILVFKVSQFSRSPQIGEIYVVSDSIKFEKIEFLTSTPFSHFRSSGWMLGWTPLLF